MSLVDETKTRLLSDGTPFKAVAGATALAAVKDRPVGEMPQAFVLVAREASTENQRAMTGPVLQRMERDLMVVIFAEDVSEPFGGATGDQLEEIKSWVRGRLVGFVPTDMKLKISHVGGEVVEAVKGLVCFEDTYSAPTYIEEV